MHPTKPGRVFMSLDDARRASPQPGDVVLIRDLSQAHPFNCEYTCYYRIGSAAALEGHAKIYLDGQEQPAVDLPFKDYFTGKTAPFHYPQLSHDLAAVGSQGRNLYYPIPYRKSCKIVAEKGWGRYYQFVNTTFPQGTNVPTFSEELAAANAESLKTANAFFQDQLGADPAVPRSGQQAIQRTVRVEPGKSESSDLGGLTAVTAKTMLKDSDDQTVVLRKLAIKIAPGYRLGPAHAIDLAGWWKTGHLPTATRQSRDSLPQTMIDTHGEGIQTVT